ncbi:MAG: L-threonylcarbamoyladenylate synthase [Aureliella sp.]
MLDDPGEAAELLRQGGVVAFPTETVYGLGANARDETAVNQIFQAKGRPSNNPLIVHVAAPDQWSLAARDITSAARVLFDTFSPGPLTVVLPKLPAIASNATGGLDTVGIRVPEHLLARDFLSMCNVPVAAPSANLSGRPSCTTWQSVMEDLDGRIDAVLKGPPPTIGVESTVVDCTREIPVLLRPGGISLQQLQSAVPETISLQNPSAQHPSTQSEQATRSPGLLHPHYQPRAKVHLVPAIKFTAELLERTSEKLTRGEAFVTIGTGERIELRDDHCLASYQFGDIEQLARDFYESLRRADRLGAKHILVQLATGDSPIVSALRDRQQRSAE